MRRGRCPIPNSAAVMITLCPATSIGEARPATPRDTAAKSVIYWNAKTGFDAARRTDLPTLGASSVAVGDLDRDGKPDLFFANHQDGSVHGRYDTYLYWGNERGAYSAANRLTLPAISLTSYSAADLNNDGYADLILVGSELRICWGSAVGISLDHSSVLPAHT